MSSFQQVPGSSWKAFSIPVNFSKKNMRDGVERVDTGVTVWAFSETQPNAGRFSGKMGSPNDSQYS